MSKFLTLGNRVVNTDQITHINLDGLDADRRPCIVVNFPGGDFIRIEKKSPAADTLRAWLAGEPVAEYQPQTQFKDEPLAAWMKRADMALWYGVKIDGDDEPAADNAAAAQVEALLFAMEDAAKVWEAWCEDRQMSGAFTDWVKKNYDGGTLAQLFYRIHAAYHDNSEPDNAAAVNHDEIQRILVDMANTWDNYLRERDDEKDFPPFVAWLYSKRESFGDISTLFFRASNEADNS